MNPIKAQNPDDAALFAMVQRAGGNMKQFQQVRNYQATKAGAQGFWDSFQPKNIPGNLGKAALAMKQRLLGGQ